MYLLYVYMYVPSRLFALSSRSGVYYHCSYSVYSVRVCRYQVSYERMLFFSGFARSHHKNKTKKTPTHADIARLLAGYPQATYLYRRQGAGHGTDEKARARRE